MWISGSLDLRATLAMLKANSKELNGGQDERELSSSFSAAGE